MSADQRMLRVGVLGAGQISQAAHFEACRKAKNAELYAICDVAEELLERMFAVHAPRKAYADYDAMLADPDVDAIIIAIADQFHAPMALRALEAGKHVLVEKPMGVTVEESEDLCDAARTTGLVVQVGTEKRFDEGIAFAREFIREEMGEVLALKVWYCDSTHRYTMTDALQPAIETSENSRRPEGDPKSDLRRYYVLGHTYNPWYYKPSEVDCFSERDGTYRRPLGADGHFFRRQVEGFGDAILDGVPMRGANAEDGLAAVRGMVAMARSAQTGEAVRLSDVEGGVS